MERCMRILRGILNTAVETIAQLTGRLKHYPTHEGNQWQSHRRWGGGARAEGARLSGRQDHSHRSASITSKSF